MRSSGHGRLSILLLCDNHQGHANTVLDHISAFVDFSSHDIHLYNPRWVGGSVFLDLDEFDVVVIHYSLYILSDFYLSTHFKEKLRRFRGLKIQFIQDDYRLVYEFMDMMRFIGINILFTCYPSEQILRVWDEVRLPGVVKMTTLTGYIPDSLMSYIAPPIETRSIEIGYRGRTLPYWLGELGQEKVRIGQGVLERAEQYGLRCDIAWHEEDRIYGDNWIKFISSCKATLGTESGASITDFDGSVQRKVAEYLAKHPTASFKEVQREILLPYEGKVPIKVISPRMFEAIALRTALILFPGEYSGILKPWVHYIPLEKDFSNLTDVVEKLRDQDLIRLLTERAYQDIVVSDRYSYRTFIEEFDEVVKKYGKPHRREMKARYWLARVERPLWLALSQAYEKSRIAHPQLLFSGSNGELLAALILVLKTPPLRRIFVQYFKSASCWKNVRLKTLLKELFLIGILERVQEGRLDAIEPFSISVRFFSDKGQVVITSYRVGEDISVTANQEGQMETAVGGKLPGFPPYSLLVKGQIKSMVWDHSGISGYFIYRVKPFFLLSICVGDNGVRHFSSVVHLTTSIH